MCVCIHIVAYSSYLQILLFDGALVRMSAIKEDGMRVRVPEVKNTDTR